MVRDIRLDGWMKDHLPQKDTISRDAVEILMELLWEEARRVERAYAEECRLEKLHGEEYWA